MARPKSAVERKTFGIRLDVSLVKALKQLGLDLDREQLNLLVEEAIRDMLKKYGSKKK